MIVVFVLFSDRVAVGRALDLPVYFGDAGSREVKQSLHCAMKFLRFLSDKFSTP